MSNQINKPGLTLKEFSDKKYPIPEFTPTKEDIQKYRAKNPQFHEYMCMQESSSANSHSSTNSSLPLQPHIQPSQPSLPPLEDTLLAKKIMNLCERISNDNKAKDSLIDQLRSDLKTMSSSMESQNSQTLLLCTKMQETIQMNQNLESELNDLKIRYAEKENHELPSSSLESLVESLQSQNEKLQIENSSLLKRVVELEVTNSYVLSQLKEQVNFKPLLPTPPLSQKLPVIRKQKPKKKRKLGKNVIFLPSPIPPSTLPPLLPTPPLSKKLTNQGTFGPSRCPRKIKNVATVSSQNLHPSRYSRTRHYLPKTREVWVPKLKFLDWRSQNSCKVNDPIKWSCLGVDTYPPYSLTCLGVTQESHPGTGLTLSRGNFQLPIHTNKRKSQIK